MKKLFLTLTLLLALSVGVAAAQDDAQQQTTEIVDSANGQAIEVYSDTTAAADTTVKVEGVADSDAEWDDLETWFKSDSSSSDMIAIGLSLLVLLFGVGMLLLPLILIIALVVWMLRRRRPQQEPVRPVYDINGRRLLRRSNDRMLGGVCAGVAEYFNIDTILVRLLYACLTLFTAFSGVIVYIIAWIVIPPIDGREP